MRPSIVVHGGAWDMPDEVVEAHIRGCTAVSDRGFELLESGASAVEAVVEAVAVMEDDPTFDAGVGSVLTRVGRVEMDAIVMNGSTLRSGAVAALQHVRNPVRVARKVMEDTPHSLLAGAGALEFAIAAGFEECSEEDLLVGRELEDYHEFLRTGTLRTRELFSGPSDTVGACAVDSDGHTAAATSTGGIPRKMSGRVGDSPLIGSGAYADDTVGAVSATGWGEKIMAVVLSKTAIDAMRERDDPSEACATALSVLKDRVDGLGGLISVDHKGNVGLKHNTPKMAYAYIAGSHERRKSGVSV
jgi:beta-aspartyl-peptidase (threonine type)